LLLFQDELLLFFKQPVASATKTFGFVAILDRSKMMPRCEQESSGQNHGTK